MQGKYVIESRDRTRGAEWGPWVELTPDTHYTRDEVNEVFGDFNEGDFGDRHVRTEWRARMLPKWGYEVIDGYACMRKVRGLDEVIDEADPPLSRDMPRQVHALNNQLLAAIGR